VLAGAAGLFTHWAISARVAKGNADDVEAADSSYFFGFILTLAFLTAGLYTLGDTAPAAMGAGGETGDRMRISDVVLRFLKDLAAGLALTILGLAVRQVRALSATQSDVGDDDETTGEPPATEELTAAIAALTAAFHGRAQEATVQDLEQARAAAKNAVTDRDRTAVEATRRIAHSVGELERAVATANANMLRSVSGLGDSMAQTMERMELEMNAVLQAIVGQREASFLALDAAQRAGAEIQTDAASQVEEHMRGWRETLQSARENLAAVHQSLDDEYKRGLEGFARSGRAFADLTERATADVQELPNPAERLAGLWESVRALEGSLKGSVQGASLGLDELRGRAEHLGVAIDAVVASSDRASTAVTASGVQLAEALRAELRRMNEILEEFTKLIERSEREFNVRR
jgi:hypothetical protein